MSAAPRTTSPPSPLDPFVRRFLAEIDQLPGGYAPVASAEGVAAACSWEPAFLEALFASARTRRLIEPFQPKGSRGRFRWRVSKSGRAWLEAAREADPGAPSPNGLHPSG